MSERDLFDAEPGFWECDLYSCDDSAEEYGATDPDEAVEELLDQNPLSGRITVYGYSRMTLGREPDPDAILERILEDLDEEYGSPYDGTEPTQAMISAAETLANVVRAEFVVWGCEQTSKATVDVEEWVRVNRPDWLDDKGQSRGGVA